MRRLTNHPEDDFDPVWSTSSPAWSPDGNWIAFAAERTGGYHIYKIDINGKNLQRLTNQGRYNLDPAWSPDGQSIAFGSIVFGTDVMDADGKHPRSVRLLVDGVVYSYFQPAWSPDGKQIACVVSDDGNDIYITDTDGQTPAAFHLLGFGVAILRGHLMVSGLPTMPTMQKLRILWKTRMRCDTFLSFLSRGASHGKSHNILGEHYSSAWVPESFFSVSPTVDTQTTLWGWLKQAERMTQ